MNKKSIIKIILAASFLILTFSIISAGCCEKSDSGYCQEQTSAQQCDGQYQDVSCSEVSFCQTGTCIDEENGMCMPNSPKATCEADGGTWTASSIEDVPQCQYGCCFIGESTYFVTQKKCGQLASEYNVEQIYRADITDEMQCADLSDSAVEGACTYSDQYKTRQCKRMSKSECTSLQSSSVYEDVYFEEGVLCTASFLGAACEPSQETMIGDDYRIYFKDTCSNKANIYNSNYASRSTSSQPDQNTFDEYWTYIIPPEESCGADSKNGNANNPDCGNCDYLDGSLASKYQRGEDMVVSGRVQKMEKPKYGDYICKSVGCVDSDGKIYNHGESWCETNNKNPNDNTFYPGTESYQVSCLNGDIVVDSCSVGGWRSSICRELEDEDGKSSASCVPNLWTDCLTQTSKEDCEDSELRDCVWLSDKNYGRSVLINDDGSPMKFTKDGEKIENDDTGVFASCVPKYSPATNNEDDSIKLLDYLKEKIVIVYSFPNAKNIKNKLRGEDSSAGRKERFEYCGERDKAFGKVKDDGRCAASDASPIHEKWLAPRDQICKSVGDTSLEPNFRGYMGEERESMFYKFVLRNKDVQEELAGSE